MSTKVLIPSGVLGLGFSEKALWLGIQKRPDIICIDGGSTDSGPHYLGTGTSKYSQSICKSEWRQLLKARAKANVPLVIGSCGTCGVKQTVDQMFHLTQELAEELSQHIKVARIYSDQAPKDISAFFESGKVNELPGAPMLNCNLISECTNIVALAGVEQIQAALIAKADVILIGRATDTATIAALPLLKGESAGSVWHGAKIGECGAFCSDRPTSGVIMIEFNDNEFTVTPMEPVTYCTSESVAAHMLYENSDPTKLLEPGGMLDVANATYEQVTKISVRVTGSVWIPNSQYTVKLEGARQAGYQTSLLAIIRDRYYVKNVKIWSEKLQVVTEQKIKNILNLSHLNYSLEIRLIGINSTLGKLEKNAEPPLEVGVLIIITALNQELATEIAQLVNPYLLHMPLTVDMDMPTFAFPYSPAHTERGAVYEFVLHHTLDLDDPMDAFSLQIDDLDYGTAR